MNFISSIDLKIDNWLNSKKDLINRFIPNIVDKLFIYGAYFIPVSINLIYNTKNVIYYIPLISSVVLLKYCFGRLHPEQTNGEDKWYPFEGSFGKTEYQAIPSGHTAISLFSALISNNIFLWIYFFLTILIMLFKRHHWFSDIVFGALLSCMFFIFTTL